MNLKQSLTENIGVKLIAFVVAVFIWFNASGQQQMVRLRDVPLVIQNVPDSLTLTGTIPSHVQIRVTGTRRQLLTMGFKQVQTVVDLTDARPGNQRVSLSSNNVRLPSGFDRSGVSIISPTSVDIFVERLISKRVQVALSTMGEIGEEHILLDGAMSVDPTWITVSGPASVVERIKTVPTETVDLTRLNESLDRKLALDYDAGLFSCAPPSVNVTITISQRGERVMANIPPTVLVDSEDYEAVVLPNAVSLTIEGPVEVLNTLSSGDVSVVLNLAGRLPAQYTLAPEIILPAGVTLAGISVDSLVVRISNRTLDAEQD